MVQIIKTTFFSGDYAGTRPSGNDIIVSVGETFSFSDIFNDYNAAEVNLRGDANGNLSYAPFEDVTSVNTVIGQLAIPLYFLDENAYSAEELSGFEELGGIAAHAGGLAVPEENAAYGFVSDRLADFNTLQFNISAEEFAEFGGGGFDIVASSYLRHSELTYYKQGFDGFFYDPNAFNRSDLAFPFRDVDENVISSHFHITVLGPGPFGDGNDFADFTSLEYEGVNTDFFNDAGAGDDEVILTDDPDTFYGGSGNDTITGNDGADTIYGGSGSDTIYGESGNDRVFSEKGSDVIILGAGNDYVRVGGGREEFYGGSGIDYISYYDSTNGITANLEEDTVSDSWAVNDTIEDFESISGSRNGDDSIIGTNGANVIRTYGGNDRVAALKGADLVELGSGNDYVRVGGGQESFFGGSGVDYISYYDSANGIRIDLRDDEVSGSWAVNDVISDFESASGSKTGSDVMLGTNGANTLRGYGGNDKLYGRSGSDKLYGGSGSDFLDGGGGSGTDLLYGGSGADVFEFDRGEGVDVIKDFENNIDQINLDNFAFSTAQAYDFAEQDGDDVVFDFGVDGMLTIENTTIGRLQNDLDVV